jgi:hypothetical protein
MLVLVDLHQHSQKFQFYDWGVHAQQQQVAAMHLHECRLSQAYFNTTIND